MSVLIMRGNTFLELDLNKMDTQSGEATPSFPCLPPFLKGVNLKRKKNDFLFAAVCISHFKLR